MRYWGGTWIAKEGGRVTGCRWMTSATLILSTAAGPLHLHVQEDNLCCHVKVTRGECYNAITLLALIHRLLQI